MCFRFALHSSLRIAFVLVICVALLPVLCISSRAKEWRGIVPLHSTRTDVERLLGLPKTDRSDTIVYETDEERISIEFSKGPCNVEFSSWNVSAGTVISIWVTPKLPRLNTRDLHLNQKGYIKFRDDHRLEVVHYRNEAEGIEYNVHEETGEIGLIKYFPAAADESLRCPEPRNRL
jgi:hypothetical protein